MPNVVIMNAGLQYASSAHDSGPLVAIEYWVPVYDYRIDPTIHNEVSTFVANFSAVADPSASAPVGEIIWNTDGSDYALSDVAVPYIISAGTVSSAGGGVCHVTSNIQSQLGHINVYKGVPLTDHMTGSRMEHHDTNPTHTWDISSYSVVVGSDTPSLSGNYKYFPITDYYPTEDDAGRLRGTIKFEFSKDIGSIRFNKIALFATRYSGGVRTSEEPVFFAESFLGTAIEKVSMSDGGFDNITCDVQIDITSISANWQDVFFASSATFWTKCPNGLYWPDKVGIGQFRDSIDEPAASLHVRRPRANDDAGTAYTQLRLDYDNSAYMTVGVDGNGEITVDTQDIFHIESSSASNQLSLDYSSAIWTRFHTDSSGDLTIDPHGTHLYTKHILPSSDASYALGSQTKRFSDVNTQKLSCISGGVPYTLLVNAVLTPNSSAIDIGTSSNRFESGYFKYTHARESVFDLNDYVHASVGYDSSGNFIIDSSDNITMISSNFLPQVSDYYDIGSTSVRFNYGYFKYTYCYESIYKYDDYTLASVGFNSGGTFLIDSSSGAVSTRHVLPLVTNASNLGSSDKVWKNIYVNNLRATSTSITSYVDILPNTTGSRSLGNMSLKWAGGYFGSINAGDVSSDYLTANHDVTGATLVSNGNIYGTSLILTGGGSSTGGIFELGRSVRSGYWTTLTGSGWPHYNLLGGSGSISFGGGGVSYFKYTIIGKTVFISAYIGFTVTGEVTLISLVLPDGTGGTVDIRPIDEGHSTNYCSLSAFNPGEATARYKIVQATGTDRSFGIYRLDTANFPTGYNTMYITGFYDI